MLSCCSDFRTEIFASISACSLTPTAEEGLGEECEGSRLARLPPARARRWFSPWAGRAGLGSGLVSSVLASRPGSGQGAWLRSEEERNFRSDLS